MSYGSSGKHIYFFLVFPFYLLSWHIIELHMTFRYDLLRLTLQYVGVRSREVELGASMQVVAGWNPAQTELASTVARSYYSSPNDVK